MVRSNPEENKSELKFQSQFLFLDDVVDDADGKPQVCDNAKCSCLTRNLPGRITLETIEPVLSGQSPLQ